MGSHKREINQILDRGALALEKAFRPGKAVHVGIDWQRTYCDPTFPLYQCGGLQLTQRVLSALARMNDTVRELRPLIPTCWISHDVAVNRDMIADDSLIVGLSRDEVRRTLKELHEEGGRLCGDVRPEDRVFVKKDFNAYSSEDFLGYLKEKNSFVHLLSGLVRTHCVKETEHNGADRGYSVFVMEDLTVDALGAYDDTRLHLFKQTNRHGSHCVRSEDVKAIAAKYQP